VIVGILFGLVAALLQSLGYVVSGSYVKRTGRPGWTLVAPERVVSILPSAMVTWFARPTSADYDWGPILFASLVCAVTVYLGDTGLFQAQKSIEPSRVAPMQALKIPLIALLSFCVFGTVYGPGRIVALALVLAATALLAGAGRRIPPTAWAWMLVCACGYACSDLSAGRVLAFAHTDGVGVLRSSMFALGVTHLVTGLLAIPMLAVRRGGVSAVIPARDWLRYAAPYAALWLSAMVFLFVSFDLAGVVLGAIAQSTRGLISVVLGVLLARHGFGDVEEKVSRAVFIRRIVAAVLILLAMVLYASF